MSDMTPLSQATSPVLPVERRSNNRLSAAFLSVAIPGAGHFLINRRRLGITLLSLFCILLFICWPLRLPTHFGAVVGLGFGMLALCISATVDSAYGGRHSSGRPSQWWLVILLPLAFGAAIAHLNWAVRIGGFQNFEVPSLSMENTIPMDARVMVDRWYYTKNTPRRGDIVIYLNREGIYLMKRVIAQGGETIRSSDGIIFIDGAPISEPYVIHSGYAPLEMNNFGPLKIPAGKLFVMGDNRDISLDSRSPEVGPIEVTSLRGRALYTLAGLKNRTYKHLR
jgi:signal peptidase I